MALEKTISTLTMQIKQLQVEVVTLEGRLKDMGIKNNLKVAAVEVSTCSFLKGSLHFRVKANSQADSNIQIVNAQSMIGSVHGYEG